jgi:peptide chain release factor 2
MRAETEARAAELQGENISANFGNQIRSYVLQPYRQIKDLRSGFETSDTSGVLDGDLDPMIHAYLQSQVQTSGTA